MLDPVIRAGATPPAVASAHAVPSLSVSREPAGVGQGDADFAALIGQAVADLAHKLRAAEVTSLAGVQGQASMQDVVETVMSAEQSLQAAIAVRDKIVSAYLEISRMAI